MNTSEWSPSDYVNWIRSAELERVMPLFRRGERILEVGAGTGRQALELRMAGFDVEAIDLESSNYAETRIFPIVDYDGRNIPFPDNSFDVVFSSNVLEHVPDLQQMHAEIRRVLRQNGRCIHVVPAAKWQFWTIVSGYPLALRSLVRSRRLGALKSAAKQAVRALFPARHGERGNAYLELWYFSRRWWRRNFTENGFAIAEDRPLGLFYTGNAIFGARWPLDLRERLARRLGSVTHVYVLKLHDAAAARKHNTQPNGIRLP